MPTCSSDSILASLAARAAFRRATSWRSCSTSAASLPAATAPSAKAHARRCQQGRAITNGVVTRKGRGPAGAVFLEATSDAAAAGAAAGGLGAAAGGPNCDVTPRRLLRKAPKHPSSALQPRRHRSYPLKDVPEVIPLLGRAHLDDVHLEAVLCDRLEVQLPRGRDATCLAGHAQPC